MRSSSSSPAAPVFMQKKTAVGQLLGPLSQTGEMKGQKALLLKAIFAVFWLLLLL